MPSDPMAAHAAEQTVQALVDSTQIALEGYECDCGKKTCCAPEGETFSLDEAGVSDEIAAAILDGFSAQYERRNGLRRIVLSGAWEVDPLAAHFPARTATDPIDWIKLAHRLSDIQTKLVHDPNAPRLYGDEFYAEALRRTLGYSANDGSDGQRELPYETINQLTGLTTCAAADHLRDSHTIVDRLNLEAAQKRVTELRVEVQRVYREARADIADSLREWYNERTVPSRLRREGVLLAADRLAPASEERAA